MREIIFRGKTVDENEWIYGDIFHSGAYPEITRIHDYINRVNYAVNPETVGEFTGLTDKNGVRIFEGDILESFCKDKRVVSVVKYGAFKPDFFYDFAHECGYDMSVKVYGLYAYVASNREDIMLAADMQLASVIGNIYDNPELVGGDDNAAD